MDRTSPSIFSLWTWMFDAISWHFGKKKIHLNPYFMISFVLLNISIMPASLCPRYSVWRNTHCEEWDVTLLLVEFTLFCNICWTYCVFVGLLLINYVRWFCPRDVLQHRPCICLPDIYYNIKRVQVSQTNDSTVHPEHVLTSIIVLMWSR